MKTEALTQYSAGQRITYPASAWHGKAYPDFEGTIVEVIRNGYLLVQFDQIKAGDIRTIVPADLVQA